MRTALVSLILITSSVPAAAGSRSCANLLYSRGGMGRVVTQLDFDRSAERAIAARGIRISDLRRFLNHQSGLTLINHPGGGVYGVLFNPDPRRLDKGYVLRGARVDDRLVVHSFYESSHAEDRRYFEGVASVHGIRARRLDLKKAVLDCKSLMLLASTQVKLWLKHRLAITDVLGFLNRSRVRFDAHRVPVHGRNRFAVEGRDRDDRAMRVIIQDEGLCPHGLITAYEPGYP